MVTRDDVPHDTRLPEPIVITVKTINRQPNRPRDVELTVTDEVGNELDVIIWKTHNVNQAWVEDEVYELDGVRGKRYATETRPRVELHSTKDFQVRELSRSHSTRIFVIGDTHVGYRHRARSNKPKWARDVDNRETFAEALRRAREADVDAVVHAGDVFDHSTRQSDLDTVYDEVSRTSERGIPFYFVRGNHDRPSGRRLLNRLADEYSNCSRLRKDPVYLGTPRVLLYGVDHVGGDLPEIHRKPTFRILPFPTILVIHETPYPVVNDNGDLTHKQNGPNLEVFLTNSTLEPDLIISGHMHVWSRGIVRDHQVPVLVPGPTAPISTYKKDNTPSTWLVTARNGGLEIEQHPL